MTSSFASNSQAELNTLYGEPQYLRAKYMDPNVPIEEQIPITSTSSAQPGGVNYTTDWPKERVWSITSDLAGGSSIYTLNNEQANNMIGRQLTIVINALNGGTNTVGFTLPAGWFWDYSAAANPLIRHTATTPQLGTTSAIIDITFIKGSTVNSGIAIVTSPITGWTFS